MSEGRKDNVVIGLMVILTYFLIYSFLRKSNTLGALGGLPLIDCTISLIMEGFSASVMSTLMKDFAQTIIVIFIVVFVQNLLPKRASRRAGTIVITLMGYIVLYLTSMWLVRYVIFTDRMNDIIQMFISIFAVVFAGLGAVFASPLRRIISEHLTRNYLRNYLMESRVMHWLADSFFISTVILFLAIAIEMSVGLLYFFTVVIAGFPTLITIIIMIGLLYYMVRL